MPDLNSSLQSQPQSRPAGARLRVKILGGQLTAEQWRTLAAIAAEFTPNAPLHLTTRQDVEFHDVRPDDVVRVQERLHQSGLAGKTSCGDTVRNTTVCTCSGVRTGAPDLAPLGWLIRRTLEQAEGPLALPRKFKVSLSACEEGCAQPWINDVGLVLCRRSTEELSATGSLPASVGTGGQAARGTPQSPWAFRAIVAGSLGPKPALGVVFHEQLSPNDAAPLALAALRVFAAHGDRKNRSTARLRHVRQRLGDGPFAAVLQQAFEQARAEREWPAAELPETTTGFDVQRLLTFADGNASPAAAEAVARLAERADLRVRIDTHQRVVVAARDQATLDGALAGEAELADAARPQPTVVVCPGRRWCKNALTDPAALAERIRRELGDRLPPGTIVGVSGCRNNCTHNFVADIGLSGRVVTIAGQRQDAFDLVTGGGLGQTDQPANPVASALSADEVIRRLGATTR